MRAERHENAKFVVRLLDRIFVEEYTRKGKENINKPKKINKIKKYQKYKNRDPAHSPPP